MKKRYGLLLFITAMGLMLFGTMLMVDNRQAAANQAKQIVLDDQAGKNVETDLIKLRVYVASHMKTNVKFVLTGSYDRALAAAKAQSSASSAVYAAAQASCDKRGVDSIRQSQCVAAYIAANSSGTATDVKLPDIAKYTYHYVGPAWSFDVAGIILILGFVLAIFSVVAVVHRAVTK
jgi:hypothetical protein